MRKTGRRPTSESYSEPDDAADGVAEPETGPLRRCIVTRERLPKERMIRFVLSPDRVLTPDLGARLPGRGIWLSANGDVLETARTRGAFARAARGQVTIPQDLPALLQAGLLHRIADLLGLARRAGQTVCGYAKTREWIVGGRAAVIVQAIDGSPDERRRIVSGARSLPVVSVMTATRLAAAFGRDHVVHAALSRGALADRLVVESGRFAGLAGLAVPVRQADDTQTSAVDEQPGGFERAGV
ncbi:RNA-binding protein [Endosaccharibacter trunci]|uniref:RNA-binding protein n=1 Tax=Endosaccharibacter trunci TaxID=2812733 RepID=UPI003BF60526